MTTSHRFILQPYKGPATRHTCPACDSKRQFVRYLDTETGELMPDHVGRCNREASCGYHYPPKQFFQDNPDYSKTANWKAPTSARKRPAPVPPPPPTYHPPDLLVKSLKGYDENNFVRFLLDCFSDTVTERLINRYLIGSAKQWPGATVFWQIDATGRIRAGKVMHYHPDTGKRLKDRWKDGSEHARISWVHTLMGLETFTLRQCFFGEHLLKTAPHTQPVAIVESEKTALIGSVIQPVFVWLATGGSSGVKMTEAEVCNVLKGRKVTLFPDVGAFDKWKEKARLMETHIGRKVRVSDLLENKHRPANWDLADDVLAARQPVLLTTGPTNWVPNALGGYPVFWDHYPTVKSQK